MASNEIPIQNKCCTRIIELLTIDASISFGVDSVLNRKSNPINLNEMKAFLM